MKKLIAVSILLIALSAAVFAQELKFGGYVESGLGVKFLIEE
ncbi:hypothetical protein AGMMS49944_19180 [Spirochaetia bacterium]|nr:hypothetical protein AGMMS49944_19180 [Spirochaetia bacterium]